ncbi:MAG: hypothetical protein ACLPXZ_30050 [Mycobacterium sp.]
MRFAAESADQRVMAIAERAGAPLRVAVHGRPGVGCRTVARALDKALMSAGVTVTSSSSSQDVLDIYVLAEVVKPEDRRAIQAIADARRPVLAVLNKADLGGWLSHGGPAAHARCAQFSELLGVAVEPMIALLAVAGLDDLDPDLWAALRTLAAHPGGLAALDGPEGSYDGFLAADLPVPAADRRRLLETLDLFGTALGIAAVQGRKTPAQARALWRKVSHVDAIVDKLVGTVNAVGAEARYRRVLDAVAELAALAVSAGDLGAPITEFLSHDDTVVARMAAATDLTRALGLEDAEYPEDLGGSLPRAVRWQRYSRGPISDVHRACAADIARGSLRLWIRGSSRGLR